MARLPQPGGDAGNWGQILNDYLTVGHATDGTVKDSGVIATKYVKPSSGIPVTDLSAGLQSQISSAIPSTQKGAANGVASLDNSGLLPKTQLGSGTASATTFLRGDGSWSIPSTSAGPKTFVQSTDPGSAAQDGDIWIDTSL